jgi:hypothetical protein
MIAVLFQQHFTDSEVHFNTQRGHKLICKCSLRISSYMSDQIQDHRIYVPNVSHGGAKPLIPCINLHLDSDSCTKVPYITLPIKFSTCASAFAAFVALQTCSA